MSLDYSSAEGATSPSARRIILISAFTVACTAAFFYFRPADGASTDADAQQSQQDAAVAAAFPAVPFDSIVKSAVSEALTVPAASEWTLVTIKPGTTLSDVFDQYDLPAEDWLAITRLGGDAARLKHIKVGEHLRMRIASGTLEELVYPLDETRTLSVRREDDGFEATTLTAAIERRSTEAAGTINNSLFADGRKAGLDSRMVAELADIFASEIDFGQDLQEGDRFSVVYEQLYKDGKKLRNGDILAAEFINQGRHYRAVRYVASDGTHAYYTPEGQSLRKAFIRTPVDFTRISSGFTMHRWHPILNRMRAHMGTDYAAPIGTPVHASGNGRIEFMGRKGGYGNVVVIRHDATYETVYGHLSRFQRGLHAGSKVQQGQVIAFVGMTGLATGPHLHYEFRVNGLPVNPVTVTLPRANPITPQMLAEFRTQSASMVAELETMGSHQYAQAELKPAAAAPAAQ
jgi:murein DD-endopeptidase MepM/ murein hydrolase activator NlpD